MTTPSMASEVPDRFTKATPSEMFEALGQAWRRRFGSEPSRNSLLVLLAQWSIETGEGARMHCWNVGNVKSVAGDGHDYTFLSNVWEGLSPAAAAKVIASGEAVKSTNPSHIAAVGPNKVAVIFQAGHPQTRFRAFPSLEAGVESYVEVLYTRFAKAWPSVIAGDPEGFVHQLVLADYFTANEKAYARELRRRFNEYSAKIAAPSAAEPNVFSIKEVQQLLTQLGYSPGQADGVMGMHTKEALKAFQAAQGLTPDGVLGPKTRTKLLEAWRLR